MTPQEKFNRLIKLEQTISALSSHKAQILNIRGLKNMSDEDAEKATEQAMNDIAESGALCIRKKSSDTIQLYPELLPLELRYFMKMYFMGIDKEIDHMSNEFESLLK